jgi:hypothetical protein
LEDYLKKIEEKITLKKFEKTRANTSDKVREVVNG